MLYEPKTIKELKQFLNDDPHHILNTQLDAQKVWYPYNRMHAKACAMGWYDWFCDMQYLWKKGEKLAKKMFQLSRSEKIGEDKRFMFKNNCPMWYNSTYDDFRILDDNGDVLYTVTPRVWHKDTGWTSEVWGNENGFDGPLVSGNWWDVRRFFGV